MIPKELQNLRPLQGDEGLARDADYMGAIDIDDGAEPILTIQHLYNGEITLSKGKEKKKVITFVEERVPGIREVRPLVLNRTNWKTLKKLFGTMNAATLEGKKIQLYLQPGIRNPGTGEKGSGIRIREKIPTGAKYEPPKCAMCGKVITGLQNYTAEQIAATNKQRYGKPLCVECGKKLKAEMDQTEAERKAAEEAVLAAQKPQEAPAEQDDLLAALQAEAEG